MLMNRETQWQRAQMLRASDSAAQSGPSSEVRLWNTATKHYPYLRLLSDPRKNAPGSGDSGGEQRARGAGDS